MPRTHILHYGYLSPQKTVDLSSLNRLNQDDVIAHLLAAYKHCGVALCDW